MLRVTSREYKVMLRAEWFESRREAIGAFLEEVGERASLYGVTMSGELAAAEKRQISFLDTPDWTFLRNGFLFRRRLMMESGEVQFTLKRRSPDRYFAQGVDLSPAAGFMPDEKLEEDIAAVFNSRFSHSMTVTIPAGEEPQTDTLADASTLFPILATLQRDGQECSPETVLRTVNGAIACERVYKGFWLEAEGLSASVAVILWSRGWKGRPTAAEFSFRYKDKKERYSAELAALAEQLFLSIQGLSWCAPASSTKTQFIYGES